MTIGGEVMDRFCLGQAPELNGGMLSEEPLAARYESRLKAQIESQFPVNFPVELRTNFGALSRADRKRLYSSFCKPKQIAVEDMDAAEFSIWVAKKLHKFEQSDRYMRFDTSRFVEFADPTQPEADAASVALAGGGGGR